MHSLTEFEAQQELNKFNDLMQNKEVLTKEEYDFCTTYDADAKKDLHFMVWTNTALNLNVYTEHDHEKF